MKRIFFRLKKQYIIGIIVLLCLAAAIPVLLLPTSAMTKTAEAKTSAGSGAPANKRQKEEIVYVRLSNDGTPDEIYVVNSFILDGEGMITDYGNYSYVKNLTNSDVLKLENGKVTANTEGDVLYYEGFLPDAELPWDFSIAYSINGSAVPAEELGGKSGHMEMTVRSSANPRGSREFFDRYCLQVSVTLSSDFTGNVCSETGTTVSNGKNKQISFVVFPGKETVMEISADVVNIDIPAVTVAGLTMNMDLDFDDTDMSDILELIDGLVDLDDGVSELLDGIFDMRGGVRDLYDGAIEFNDGANELKDGVEELNDGVEELKDGTSELKDGVEELSDGVAEMTDGINEMLDGANELADGFREFYDGILELKDGAGDMYYGAEELFEAVEELCDGLDEIVDGAKGINLGLSGFAAGAAEAAYGGIELYRGFEFYFDEAILKIANEQVGIFGIPPLDRENYEEILLPLISGPTPPPGLPEIYGMLYGFDTLLTNLNEYAAGVRQIDINSAMLSGGMSKFTDGLIEYRDGFGEYSEGMEEFLEGVDIFATGVNKLKDGSVELKDGVYELRDGIAEFRSGVIELRDGVIELCDGIVELHSGVIELCDGVIELHDGVIEFCDGAAELQDGVRELLDGTLELYDGAGELKDGTDEIRQNTVTLDSDIIDGIKEAAEEMMGGDGPVISFASPKNGEIGAVQFLMQTKGMPAREYVTAGEPVEAETGFWQRLLALFGAQP